MNINVNIDLTSKQEEQIGKDIIRLLNIQPILRESGQFATAIGTKTELGLGRIVLGIIEANINGNKYELFT